MKKLYFLLLLLIAATSGQSQLLTEDFNYPAGQLITANGWTAHSAGANPITVTAPGLTYAGHPGSGVGNAVTMATSGEDDNKTFTSTNSGSVYFSFLVNLSSVQATGDYFIGLLQSNTVFPVRIYVKSDGAAGFFFGVSKGASTPVVYETTSRNLATTYFVVSKYTFNTGTTTDDVVDVWVNPALGGTETTATIANVTGTSGDATSVSAVYLRQGGATLASAQQVDAILAGTTWAQVTPLAAATPTLSATALTSFGNVCINTTTGPNSFTITGTSLTAANVTVGALAGFTYSTTTGGTYTTTLNLTQPGGAYTQEIFVKFTPTAVQSYNGNIAVGGGGATAINVAAAGAGINAPAVISGAASTVTQVSATVAGIIDAAGCSAVTAYGIEWSLTAGFPNGTGTAVPSSNLSGGNFSSDLTGLTASTTYYYHAYATNGAGTGYGAEGSFTTSSASGPTIVISQVYGGGGNTGAPFNADYVELHNNSSVSQSLSGFSIQYYTSTGIGTWSGVVPLPSASIPAGGYYLIQMSATGATGSPLPTVDHVASPTVAMAAGAGRVAIVNGLTALAGCPSSANYIDLVGYGTGTVCYEGTTGPTGTLSATLAAFRNNNGCTDTNDNASDFTTATPAPRNSATAVNICGTASPTLSATALTAFGNVCINTTAGPNSFTITGAALTAANVTVGALTGFTYSTTAGGTYTTTLSLTQPGGAYTQQIFVRFSPTLVQSYNGNIAVGGGGATAINVAAAGAGVNTIPTVTTGGASAITTTTATLAGTLPANGCTAVTAYGVEWSITNGFPNGSGTAVPSTNLSGINFSSNAIGLAPGTTYYYHAYATNAGGTAYGAQQSFTTVAAPNLTATALTGFGNVCINTTAGPNSFTITGTNLTAANVTVAALTGYTYSTTAGGTYTATLSLTQPGGSYSQQIFVRFTPTLVQSYNGNIAVGGGGASSINVAASGAGVNSVPTVTSGAASAITTNSATVAGTIPSNGCSALTTAYGIEYSTTNGFPNGSGTAVVSTNLSGINFSSNLTGLAPNTTYYYHAYATNAAGTGYGAQQQFTTLSLTPVLNATTLTAFGNVCINTTAGPNSFTISGSALNATNINVGPLTGFTFSTTAAGTYTASLSLTQPGGTYSQAIFVRFTPTLVQSYNGNIPVSGGGAAAINVAASGAGVNTTATVTTGGSSAITSISATLAGTIPTIGCSAVTIYGIEYSTTNGFPNGSGTQVPSTNLTGINFSSNVTGLTPATVYYYKAYATNNGGTVYGTQQTFTTATPALTTTALTAFGNVCINTTAGPNSFTITGTNLTTANVTVAALAGYTYSTTSGGTYTTTLSLTQPGGAYTQQIFVRFTPTLVQSYNGNIVVGGGGAASVNRAASGAGINTAPTVTSGAASAITQTTATVAGTIPGIGCSAVTAYGIEFSTTNGFPNGTGTAVASTNLTGVNFSSALTGLAPSTTYYYHAYATNAGGTAYGTQGSFTTSAPVLTATPLTGFGAICINTTAGPNSFTINSNAVTAANITVGPLNGFTFSTTAAGTYTASLSLVHAAGPFTQTIFVQFTPTAVQSYSGNIPVGGGGAATINVAITGSGSNTVATVVTGNATVLSPNSVTLAGSISSIGCSPVTTTYGIEYSSISGLANGLGTKVPSTDLSGGNFSSTLNGLVQGATYYYKAYASNNGGISYGTERSFTMTTLPTGFIIYSNPVQRGTNMHWSYSNIKPGHYEILMYNSTGQLVYQRSLILQWSFIDDNFIVPGNLSPGIYSLHISSPDFRDKKVFMIR